MRRKEATPPNSKSKCFRPHVWGHAKKMRVKRIVEMLKWMQDSGAQFSNLLSLTLYKTCAHTSARLHDWHMFCMNAFLDDGLPHILFQPKAQWEQSFFSCCFNFDAKIGACFINNLYLKNVKFQQKNNQISTKVSSYNIQIYNKNSQVKTKST